MQFIDCTLPYPSVDMNRNLASAFGESHINGTYTLSGNVSGNGSVTLDGGSGNSIVFYQDPAVLNLDPDK